MAYKHIDKFCFYLSTLNMTSKQEKEILINKLRDNITEIIESHEKDQEEVSSNTKHHCDTTKQIECQEIKLQQDICRLLINWLETIQTND